MEINFSQYIYFQPLQCIQSILCNFSALKTPPWANLCGFFFFQGKVAAEQNLFFQPSRKATV